MRIIFNINNFVKTYFNFMQKAFTLLILCLCITSCARMGTPSGGPKDITPPKFLGSKPDTLSTKVDKSIKEIILNFDEYVLVKDISKQVIISPPLRTPPTIEPSTIARKYVSVKFYEPLNENTTYTINFGSSIQDNNEGNKLNNFSYIFSTGEVIDSLWLSGKVQQSLEQTVPLTTLVSLYKIEKDSLGKDSVDLKRKPYYITKIDSAGNFKLNHLHEGRYRLIAFNDLNSNLIIDPDKEIAGFSEDIINPISSSQYNIVLSPIKQKYKVISAEQSGQGIIKFKFKGNPKEVEIKSLEKEFPPIKIQHINFSDSLFVYFDNKEIKSINKKGQIKFLVQYQNKSDTLKTIYDKQLNTKLSFVPEEKEITPSNYFTLNSSTYISEINKSKIEVFKNKEPLNFTVEKDSLNSNKINIKFPINFDTQYSIKIYANAFKDFLGQENTDTLSYNIQTKKQTELGNLSIKIQNKPTSKFFFQLLTEKYQIIENLYGDNDLFEFKNLLPGKYLIRILVDENNNGLWDTVDLDDFKPAEKTYLYHSPIDVRALWNINETWIL